MADLASVVFYLGLFALSAGLIYLGEKHGRRTIIALGLLLPIIYAALRLHVGIDYDNYVNIAEGLSELRLGNIFTSGIIEYSLYIIVAFSRLFPIWQIVFFGTYAAITLLPFYFAMRKVDKKYSWLAVLIYLLTFFAPSLNVMRQFAAISIVFYGTMNYLYSNRPAKIYYFIFAILLATFLHSSAILGLITPLVVWLSRKMEKSPAVSIIFYSILTVSIIILVEFLVIKYIGNIPILNRYSPYLTWSSIDAPVPNLIPRIAPVLIGAWALSKKSLRNNKLLCYYMLVCISFSLVFLGFLVPYGYRIADYFLIFQIPLLIEILVNTKRKDQLNVYLVVIVAYVLVYFLYSNALNNSHGIMPYQMLFFS